ncbi:MAG: hypothetical protein C0596_00920 [Marinilabiliales bacterium]|nr:MAG: hypothetical protein C0596_00920 [Marinilabiliales bacterium]
MPNIRQVSEDCVDILSPSWHGDRVIIKDNGDNLFFNKNNDTITIKTSALLDEDWQAYVLEDSLIVYAAVYNVDTLTFLGINDSVKYLSFNVFDENMIDIEHPLESKQLILSKNYGLVETVSFYHFPYSNTISDYHTYDIAFDQMVIIGMNKPDLGVTNLTKREVFDFQPGDELHITYENSFCTYSNIQDIIYIYLERNDSGDSIYYDVKRTMFQQIFNGEDYNTYFIDDTIQEIIAIDTSFNKLPDQAVSDGSIAYTNFMVNAARPLKSYNLQYAGLIVGESDCWELIFWDGCESTGDYFKGLGGPYYQCTYGTEVKKRRLQYYNIGDDEWGNPIIFTKLENGDASSNINIFPNPVKDDIISIFINNSFDFATC